MNLEDWRKSNEYSHYQSLIKQDTETKKRIKQLMVEKTELKRKQANGAGKSESTCNLQNVMCCDSFSHFIPQFGWFATEDDICLMPYIQSGDLKMRINYCPSCGKYVRDIQIPKKELMSFFS